MDDDTRPLAVQLHDGAMQEITLARLQLDLLRTRMCGDAAVADELDVLAGQLDRASAALQALMRQLGSRAATA